jgi:hypothetical protein
MDLSEIPGGGGGVGPSKTFSITHFFVLYTVILKNVIDIVQYRNWLGGASKMLCLLTGAVENVGPSMGGGLSNMLAIFLNFNPYPPCYW